MVAQDWTSGLFKSEDVGDWAGWRGCQGYIPVFVIVAASLTQCLSCLLCWCDDIIILQSALIISASIVNSVTQTCPPFNSIQSGLLAPNVESNIQTSLS